MGLDFETACNDMNENSKEKEKGKENESKQSIVNENQMNACETEHETEQQNEEKHDFVRKQYRGFTITVSPPDGLINEDSVTSLTQSKIERDVSLSKQTEANYLCDGSLLFLLHVFYMEL
jgi:hypothetical protein